MPVFGRKKAGEGKMSSKSDGSIYFEISLNLDKLKTEIKSASDRVKKEFTDSFKTAGKKCEVECQNIANKIKKTADQATKSLKNPTENVKQQVKAAAENIQKEISKTAGEINSTAKETAQDVINETEKATDEVSEKIKEILNDTNKSMKSKAMSIAGIYKKQGMNASDAMKKAWSEIERQSGVSTKKVKKDIGKIGTQAKETSNTISGSILPVLKKAAFALAAAFSVKQIIDFGASCIELGSDLQEVQNVVDVSFPAMSKQVDAFAQSAAASFGLSETMAKRFTGTFGAMAKAFGFSEKQAYEMSTALTGLAGDVASFYNITQDEAYTKLKSVFTGETESLKDLGVVMTQAALDQYALANGFGKTTAKMTEAEKVALRYKFVQEQLTSASGDFIRTSDSWANQVRVLQLQFDSFKASVGQGLINVLTPVIKVINLLMQKLVALGNMFKNFTEMIMGKSSAGNAAADTAASMEAAASSSDSMASGVDSANSSAKKLKKTLSTLAVDSLNILNSNSDDSSSSGSSGGSAGGTDIGIGDTVSDTNELSNSTSALQKCIDKLAESFKKGFDKGLGDDFENSLKRIKGHVSSIGTSLKEIFTDKTVVASATGMALKISESFGKTAGSFASIGTTIAENVAGGADKYLQQNSGYIKERLVGIFDATGESAEIVGNLNTTIAEIFEVFRGEEAKQCTADLIGIVANSSLGITQLAMQIGRDIIGCISKPITDNKDKIKQAIENTLSPISTVLSTLNTAVQNTFGKVFEVYDAKIRPAFEGFAEGFSSIVSTLLDAYNTHIAPVLDNLSEKFSEVWQSSIQPAIEKIISFIGKLADNVSTVWKTVVAPFINWLINTLVPVLAPIIEIIGETFLNVFGAISTIIGGVMDVLGGLLDFVTGLFKGDWEQCWEGAKSIFEGFCGIISGLVSGLWSTITGVFSGAINIITGIVTTIWNTVTGIFTTAWNAITSIISTAWDMIAGVISNAGENIKFFVTTAWNAIKNTITSIVNGIKNVISTAWKAIKTVISTVINNIKTVITNVFNGIKKVVTSVWNGIKTIITSVINGIKTNISNKLSNIKETFTTIFTSIKTTVKKIFDGIWTNIKNTINSILGGVEKMANGVINGINGMIGAMNKLKFDIPDWVPELGGKTFGFAIPTIPELNIPKLAQGGYVKANTPQLAMIGDNRHQGEVVAPEDKLYEIAYKAMTDALEKLVSMMAGQKTQYADAGDIVIPVYLNSKKLEEFIITAQQRRRFRSGGK